MNILFLVKDMEYANGGVCTQILTLAKEYIQSGNKVLLVAEGTDFEEDIHRIGINYIDDIKMKSVRFNPFSFLLAYKAIRKLVKLNEIDIVHVHTQSALPIVYLLKKSTGIPYIWTNHIDDIPHPRILKQFHRLMKFPIISVSESCREDLIDRFNIDKRYIKVIPNGINLNNFTELSSEERHQLNKEFRIDSNNYNICILSRVAFNKGHDILVRAIKLIQQRGTISNIRLIVAGSMQEKEWYDKEVHSFSEQNNIELNYIGFRSPRDIFGIADLFVLPSRKEGFGMVCIEALAMHCPVVRSNSPGWNEMVDYARVVKIGDIPALADAIEDAYKNKEKTLKMTEAGFQAVKSVFNSSAMAESTMNIYKTVINKEWPNNGEY